LERVRAVANTSTRSTQNIGIEKMIKNYGFKVVVPPDKEKAFIYNLLINYKRSLSDCIDIGDIMQIKDI